MIVCIPSKGRPSTKTYKLFEAEGFKVFHFLEPQEMDKYDVPNKIDIGKNNGGITYVRNFILDWANKNSHEWAIICDDDVTNFGIYDGKTKSVGASIWKTIYEKALKLPFEIIGINYQQHAWHEKTPYSINRKFVEVCALFHVSKITWRYEENTKEDRDFALQTIQRGQGILRFNHYFFACPNVGSNAGGLHDLYKSKKDTEWAKAIVQKWHPFAKLVDKGDRIDAKIDIKGFAAHHGKVCK